MMKFLLFISLFHIILWANNDAACKKCHPTIYAEFYDSMHRKSSPKLDKVHRAVWDLHPLKEKNDYSCAKCHTPETLNEEKTEGSISCVTCHTIASIKEDSAANENIYSKKAKTFFSADIQKDKKVINFHQASGWLGLNKTTEGSPYHSIDYSNELFKNGKVCMGCHSHRQNSHGFQLCQTPLKGAIDAEQNCITCHMPQTKGSATSITQTNTHAFHGFAGLYNSSHIVAKYINITFENLPNGFSVILTNQAPHDLMLHPLRVVELQTAIFRGNQTIQLPSQRFVRLIGKNGKPTMPWIATEIVKDTMIKANETRNILFDTPLRQGDRVEARLGFYPVNPDSAQMLNLQNEPQLNKFKLLKKLDFEVK